MRPVPVGGAAAALLLLLTWLLLRGIDVEQRPFDQALTALDRVELGESAMQRDVLSARAGLLRDYDPLVQDVQMLEDAVQRLHESLADKAPVDQLAAWLAGEEPLLEEFKSDNALLQNSLAQFGQLSGRLAEPGSDGRPAVPGAGALASAMLRLALDTSPEAAREVEGRLDVLAAHIAQNGEHGLAPSVAEPAAAMLAHGRLLRDVLPAEDRTLRALLSSPSEPRREAVRAAVLAGRDAAKRVAWDYRILLYATAVLLLGCLIKLAQMLRSRALALRRRAAFEHMLAAVSTRLIRAEPAEIGSLVEGALARIAEHVGADRAYLLLAGSVKQEFLRASEGVGFPPDWSARIWSLAVRLRPSEDGVLRFSRRDPPPAGGVGNELTAAGLHAGPPPCSAATSSGRASRSPRRVTWARCASRSTHSPTWSNGRNSNRSGRGWKLSGNSPTAWRRLALSPAGSRTTSTIFSAQSLATRRWRRSAPPSAAACQPPTWPKYVAPGSGRATWLSRSSPSVGAARQCAATCASAPSLPRPQRCSALRCPAVSGSSSVRCRRRRSSPGTSRSCSRSS
jgi:hypothetical protein